MMGQEIWQENALVQLLEFRVCFLRPHMCTVALRLLNLCVASACSIQVIRNMMGQVRVVSDFFNNSPKRFGLLERHIKESLPKARHYHLIDVCRTRWVAWLDGLDVFAEVFVPLTHYLEAMTLNQDGIWNTETVCNASGIFHSVTISNSLYASQLSLIVWKLHDLSLNSCNLQPLMLWLQMRKLHSLYSPSADAT